MARTERILLLSALALLVLSMALDAGGTAMRAAASSGSIGWLTLAVLAVALAMVGSQNRELAARARAADLARTVPALGLAGALGVLLASSAAGLTAATGTAFAVLAATAIVEWSAAPEGPVTTAGLVQVGALVLAPAAAIAGVLGHDLALAEASIPLELAGIAIFLVRVGPVLLRAGWARGGRVWLVTSTVALAADAGLFAHVAFEIKAQKYASVSTVPGWLLFSVDHVTFVAVAATALFGAIAVRAGRESRWPHADVVAAAVLVLGLLAATVFIGARPAAFAIGGAVLGVATLAGVVLAALRVWPSLRAAGGGPPRAPGLPGR